MHVVVAGSDADVTREILPAFADDDVTNVDLRHSTEPSAFATVDRVAPAAVVLVPEWRDDRTRGEEDADLGGCWWWARAAALAEIPVGLVSTAAVFGVAAPESLVAAAGWSEFDRPDPCTSAGRAAHAAEQLLRRTGGEDIVVRTGPLDVGATGLPSLLTRPEGVIGGAEVVVTPLSVAALGIALRRLLVGRRRGTFHVVGDALPLRTCAERLGLPQPKGGDIPAPPALASRMRALVDLGDPAPWPPSPHEVDRP